MTDLEQRVFAMRASLAEWLLRLHDPEAQNEEEQVVWLYRFAGNANQLFEDLEETLAHQRLLEERISEQRQQINDLTALRKGARKRHQKRIARLERLLGQKDARNAGLIEALNGRTARRAALPGLGPDADVEFFDLGKAGI